MTPQEFAKAFHTGDFAAIEAGLAPEAVLYSPITLRFHFRGRDEVLDIMRLVWEVFEDWEHLHAYGDEGKGTMLFRARIGRQEVEGNDYLRYDSDGRITELRIFIRPLPGLARLAAALGPRLVGRRSRLLGVMVRLSLAPLVLAIYVADAIGARLLR